MLKASTRPIPAETMRFHCLEQLPLCKVAYENITPRMKLDAYCTEVPPPEVYCFLGIYVDAIPSFCANDLYQNVA